MASPQQSGPTRPAGPRIPWHRSFRIRLVLYFVALSFATVAAVGVIVYARASDDLTQSVFARLDTVATLKADSFGRWMDEQRRNVVFVGSIPDVRALSGVVLGGSTTGARTTDPAAATADLRSELDLLVTGTSDATAISVLDLDGKVIVSTSAAMEGRNESAQPYFVRGKSKVSVQNVYTSEIDGQPTITVSAPLLDPDRRRIGVLAANLDITRLDRLMSDRSGLGRTGETYLVDAGSRFVGNQSQGRGGDGALARSDGIAGAIAGRNGHAAYLNYAGQPVLGDYRWLPDQEVAILAEMGQDEAFAPARSLALTIGLLGLLSAALLAVGIWVIARQVSRPIVKLTTTATSVAAGDLTARTGITRTDEIGVLAATFDSMTAQLGDSVADLEQRVDERTADLTAALAAKGEAEQRYREMVEQVPAITYLSFEGGGATYVSPQIEWMLGVTAEDYIADEAMWARLIHPDDRDRMLALYEDFIERGGDDLPDYRMVRPDGRTVWIRDRAVTTRDEHDRVLVEHGVMFDVTALKETEAAMAAQASELERALAAQAETEQRYRNLVELLPVTMYIDEADSMTDSYVSPQVEAMYGWPVESWMQPGFMEAVVHPDDRQRFLAEFDRAVVDDVDRFVQYYRILDPNGRVIHLRDEALRVRDASGVVQYIMGYTQDVTDRVLAEQEVRRQKQYFEALVEISPVAIVTMDPVLRVSGWNPAAEQLFGYTPAEAMGHDIDDLIILDPELRADSLDLNRAQRTGAAHHITRRQRKDGAFVDVEIIGVPLEVGGEFTGYYAIYHDITELQRARREADEANQAKGTFLASMSHEIRTPMNAIIGMSGLLLRTDLDADQLDYAETISTSGEALLTIINDILDFSKIEAGRFELDAAPFSLAEVVEGALDVMAPAAAAKRIELAYSWDPALPGRFIGDAGRLRQIFLNLLSNSVKFTERGEVILNVTGAPLHDHGGELGCWKLAVDVRDTGIGIPPDRMDRLFQSFSQVDTSISRKYGGTGLGLAISRRLAQLMDGDLVAESTGVPGEGSTFHLTFEVEATPDTVAQDDETLPGGLGGRRALVVDDNATHRRIVIAHLDVWGLTCRETGSPLEALGWVRRGERFDVALVDLQMPEMDGLELAAALAGIPDAPRVVLLSGHGKREAGPGVAASLQKPIKPSALHDALVTVLTDRPVVGSARATAPAALDATLAARHPLRILMAEDNVVNQKLASRLLAQMGYTTDLAHNGLEAIEALERAVYDLVLMDVQMPELDGLEATRRIRDRWPARALRIVGLTANAMAGDREACLAAGMDDYVSKPIRPEALAEAIVSTSASAAAGAGVASEEAP